MNAFTHAAQTRKYISARSTPFEADSDGSKLPDAYGGNTTTRRIEFSFDLKTNASGSASLTMLPNCSFLSAFTGSSTSTDGSLSNATYNGASSVHLANVNSVDLDAVVRQHRIIGWGAKVSWTQNSQSVQGTYQIATFAPTAVSPDVVDGLTTGNTDVRLDNVYESYGIPYTGTSNTALVNHSALSAMSWYSGTRTIVKGKDIYLSSQPLDSRYANFRQSAERQVGASAEDTNVATTTTTGKDFSYTSTEGWEGFVLVLDGAATAVTSVARVTLVYHIEGIPKASSSSIRDASIQPSYVSLRDLQMANEVLSERPRFYVKEDQDPEYGAPVDHTVVTMKAKKRRGSKAKKALGGDKTTTGLQKAEHMLIGDTGDMLRKFFKSKNGKMSVDASQALLGLLLA